MPQKTPNILVRVVGDALSKGKVSVDLFTKTLERIQEAVNCIGWAEIGVDPQKRRKQQMPATGEMRLYIVRTTAGSLTAELELPKPQDDLFPDRKNINIQVVSRLKRVVSCIQSKDYASLQKELPDAHYRRQIVEYLNEIAPSPEEKTKLEIGFTGSKDRFSLTKLQKKDHPEFFQDARPVTEEKRPASESVINAKCLASVSADTIPRIRQVIDYEIDPVSAQILDLSTFIYGDSLFILKKRMALSIHREKDLFVIDYGHLDIHAVGFSSDEVLNAFKEEFSYIWHEYAMEDDDNLLNRARILKTRILKLVKKAEPVESAQNS
jgi:hypothetical protein